MIKSSLLRAVCSAAIVAAGLLTAASTCAAQSSSEIVNSTNTLRAILGTKVVPSCARFVQGRYSYCPTVASNCPPAYPVCASYKTTVGRRTTYSCQCTNGVPPNSSFVAACKAGTSDCPVKQLPPYGSVNPAPTPTPRPTPTPVVTPTPAATPSPVQVFGATSLGAENTRTKATALNGTTVWAAVGDALYYSWRGDASTTNGNSYYEIISGPNSCGWARRGPWITVMGATGNDYGTVAACQAGTTYRIVYEALNPNNQIVGRQFILVTATAN